MGSVVGEARCNKLTGPALQAWLRDVGAASHVEIKDYPDTKIKLHFSHFKIIDVTRKTCFRDPPHQCKEFAGAEEAKRGEHTASAAREEL